MHFRRSQLFRAYIKLINLEKVHIFNITLYKNSRNIEDNHKKALAKVTGELKSNSSSCTANVIKCPVRQLW